MAPPPAGTGHVATPAVPFRRRVSPFEWWIAAHPASVMPTMQLVIEGRGELSADELAAAVRRAALACPGVRLVRDGSTWVDSGLEVPVRRVMASSDDPEALCRLPEFCAPPPDQPPCEVLLVGGAVSAVVFRVAHTFMDGTGIMLWAADVFRALRGEEPRGAADPVTEDDVLAALGVSAPPPAQELRWPALIGPRPPLTAPRYLWRRLTVDGYHPGVVAKLASAVAAWSGADACRFAVPVNLRKHAPGVRSTANMVQGVLLDIAAGQSWQDTQEQMIRLLAEGSEVATRPDPSLLQVPLPALRLAYQGADAQAAKSGRAAMTASVSHLGRVDAAALSGQDFAATAVYPLATRPLCGAAEFAVLESAGRTEIILSWYAGDPAAPGRMTAVLDRVAAELASSAPPFLVPARR